MDIGLWPFWYPAIIIPMNETLKNRIKSLLWRAGMMGVAVVLAAIAQGLGGLQIQGEWVVTLGLILGEISKWLNTKAGEAK